MDSIQLFQPAPGRFHPLVLGQLEPLRQALGYSERVEVVPDRQNALVGSHATYEHRISVPPGSWLWAIAGSSEQPEGATIQVVDQGTGATLYSAPANMANVVSGQPVPIPDGFGNFGLIRMPIAFLARPRVFVEPGWLRVRITNLAPLANRIQVALYFAAPPKEGEPRNAYNLLLEHECELAHRAIRAGATQGSGPGAPGVPFIPGPTDPLDLPALPFEFDITAAAPGTYTLVPAAPGYRIAVYALDLQALDANEFTLMNRQKRLRGAIQLTGGGGYMRQIAEPRNPHWVLDEGAAFEVTVANAGRFTGDGQVRFLERWDV